jgi:hypothetical protein
LSEPQESFEKKKSDSGQLKKVEEELPLPSKSEIIRQESQHTDKNGSNVEIASGKHDPVIEKPSKTFSIKDILTDDNKPSVKNEEKSVVNEPVAQLAQLEEFTPEAFEVAWQEFTEQLKGEGNRIVSMFKSIRPELQDDQTIRIHLSNAAQKDIFILNYRPKLVGYLERKFIMSGIEIETTVDLTESNEILYSDEQKLSYLTNKYPILREMKKTFNLDIT